MSVPASTNVPVVHPSCSQRSWTLGASSGALLMSLLESWVAHPPVDVASLVPSSARRAPEDELVPKEMPEERSVQKNVSLSQASMPSSPKQPIHFSPAMPGT